MMKRGLSALAIPLLALILEILPFSAALKFAEGGIRKYSFFDLTLWGYASFAPLIAGIFTAVTVLLGVLYLVTKSKTLAMIQCLTALLGFVAALSEFTKGAEYMTAFGGIIALLLLIQAVFGYITVFKKKKDI